MNNSYHVKLVKALRYLNRHVALFLVATLLLSTVMVADEMSFIGNYIFTGYADETSGDVYNTQNEKEMKYSYSTDEIEQSCQGIVPLGFVTVTFVPNAAGATIPSVHSTRTVMAGETIGANMPPSELVQRTGFMLFAWNIEPDGSGAWFTGDSPVDQDINVYAIWGVEVAFAGNGAALPVGDPPNSNDPADFSPRVVREGFSFDNTDGIIWPNDPIHPGFIFQGWLNSVSPGGLATNATIFEQNAVLTAQWGPRPTHTLTFDLSGRGSFAAGHVGARDIREGATFAQSHLGPFWLNRNPSGVPNADPILNPNNIPRAFSYPRDYAGHGYFNANSITLHSWRVGPGGTGVMAFPDWNTQTFSPLDQEPHFITDASRTVYANWVYRVYFNANFPEGDSRWALRDIPAGTVDGTIATSAVSQAPGQAAPIPQQTMPPGNPTREGFMFGGWFTQAFPPGDAPPTGAIEFTIDCVINHSRTVFAFWIPNPDVTIIFNLEGGTWPVAPWTANQTRVIPIDSSISIAHGFGTPGVTPTSSMPHIPTKSGYVFMGWYRDLSTPSTRFYAQTIVNSAIVTDNQVNVYARWVPAITITLNFDGATTPATPTQVRLVPLGYSLREAALLWQNTRNNALVGNGAAHGPVLTLPTYNRPNCMGLRESSGLWPRWAPQWQGVFSTIHGGNGVRFGWNTVIDQAWVDAHGTSSNTATVYAIWAPIITFNNNHESRVSPSISANQTVERQLLCGQSFATNNASNFHIDDIRWFDAGPPTWLVANNPPFVSTIWPTLANWPQLELDNYAFRGWNTESDGSGDWYYVDSNIIHNRTLYAIWVIGLSFDPNGAVPGIVDQDDTIRELPGVPHPPLGANWPPDPVWNLPGGGQASFLGWNTRPDGSGIWYDEDAPITQSRNLFAIWSSGVLFHPNGGLINGLPTPFAVDIPAGTDNLISIFGNVPTPTHTLGLRFRHWNTQQTLTNVIGVPGEIVTENTQVTGPAVYYAQWDVPITFDPGVGVNNELGAIPGYAAGESTIRFTPYSGSFNTVFPALLPAIVDGTMISNPTLADHIFLGWRYYGQADNTPNLTSDEVRARNHNVPTMYIAQWVREWTVTFDLNSGVYAGNNDLLVQIVHHGNDAQMLSENPTRAGFAFTGWSPVVNITNVTEDRTFVAQWVELRTVTFDLNSGAYAGNNDLLVQIVHHGNDAQMLSENPTRAGFAFTGWAPAVNLTNVTEDRTFVAQWVELYHTVRFLWNYTGAPNSGVFQEVQIRDGQQLSAPIPAPQRTGFTFNGWFTTSAGETPFDFAVLITGDTLIYASWTAVQPPPQQPPIQPPWQPPLQPPTQIQSEDPVEPPEEEEIEIDNDNDNESLIPIDPTPVIHTHYAYMIGFEDGTVRPQANITRAEATTIFFRLISDTHRNGIWSRSNSFSDVALTGWYNTAISTMDNGGLVAGYPDASFRPNQSITRAELTALVVRFMGYGHLTNVQGNTFSDAEGHWAQDAITVASRRGWVNGFEDGTFRPDQPITRAETAALVNRMLGRLPEDHTDLLDDMVTWPDSMNVNAWYYLYIQEATNSHYHVMKADGIHETWTQLIAPRDWRSLELPN